MKIKKFQLYQLISAFNSRVLYICPDCGAMYDGENREFKQQKMFDDFTNL